MLFVAGRLWNITGDPSFLVSDITWDYCAYLYPRCVPAMGLNGDRASHWDVWSGHIRDTDAFTWLKRWGNFGMHGV